MSRTIAIMGISLLLSGAAQAADSDSGEAMLQKCAICHTLGEGGRTKVGPNLHGIFGRKAGAVAGFLYSQAMKDSGIVWDEETLKAFLRDPKAAMPGNRMSFRKFPSEFPATHIASNVGLETRRLP